MVRVDGERLEAGELGDRARRAGTTRGASAGNGLADRAHVLRRGAAAAADEVQRGPPRRTRAAGATWSSRRLVVAAEGVRQARVRVAVDEGVGEPGELLDAGAASPSRRGEQLTPIEKRAGVADRDPERLEGLAREGAPALVGEGDRDHERERARRARRRRPPRRARRPSRSACRRSSRSRAGRRRRRGGRGSARRRRRGSRSKVTARNAGSFTSGEIERVRFVGPIEPATKRGRPASRA